MYINLSGLSILVTGASRGIGRALAIKLAEAGASIAVHYNHNEIEAAQLVEQLGQKAKAFHADFSKPQEAVILFNEVCHEMGSIDVVINNAGIALGAAFNLSEDDWAQAWNQTMAVNLTSPALICKNAVQHFLHRKTTGRVINIASRAAFRGEEPEYMAYAASKAGLVSLTKTIARSYGKDGITAFTVAPGFVQTDMSRAFVQTYGADHVEKDLALGRLTEPKDIAPLVAFIASGMADHATGATFDVNAGSYMH